MRNEYVAPEVVEVGNAGEIILGSKQPVYMDNDTPGTVVSDNDLDE
jgi:hypothetical protein